MTKKKIYCIPKAQALTLFSQTVLANSTKFTPSTSTDNVDESDKSNSRSWNNEDWCKE